MSSSPESAGKVSGLSPHLNPRFSKIKQDYHKKLFNYEKEFNLKTAKSTPREKLLRDSMLAYTERVRNISNSKGRFDGDDSDTEDSIPLVVRAKHIPKYPLKRNLPRRPASLDELIGKSSLVKQERERLLKRPRSASRVSPRVNIPSLPDRLQGRSHHVKISFVSASDLYDFVDYSLRNRGTKKETLQFLKMEKEILTKKARENNKKVTAAHQRLSDVTSNSQIENGGNTVRTLPPIENKDFPSTRCVEDDVQKDENTNTISVAKNSNGGTPRTFSESGKQSPISPLKIRPNRAKRMKIRQPGLGAIPENDISANRNKPGTPERITLSSPPPKISPRNVNLESNLNAIPENDTSNEGAFTGRKRLPRINHRKVDLTRTSAFGKIDSLLSSDKRIIDLEDFDLQTNSNKLKAQKKFKKLIFLRDIPDRK